MNGKDQFAADCHSSAFPNVQIEGLRAFEQSLSNAELGWMLDCKT